MLSKTVIYRESVHIYISRNREAIRIPTGIKCTKLLENGLIGKSSGLNSEELEAANDLIREQLKWVNKAYQDYPKLSAKQLKLYITKGILPVLDNQVIIEAGKSLTFLEAFDRFIKDSENGIRKTVKERKIESNTIKNYKTVYNNLVKFSAIYDLSDWNNINERFYNSFCEYCWNSLLHFDNHVGKSIRIIKTAINYFVESKLIEQPINLKKWYNWKEEIDILVLYRDEIRLISKMKLANEKLDRTRDIFLFGISTTLRVEHLLSLTKNDIQLINGEYFINSIVHKTKKPIRIVLNSIAVQILEKYKDRYHTILPTISAAKFNENIKELATAFAEYVKTEKETNNLKIIGNDWENNFKRRRTRKGVYVNEYIKPEKYISSHIMRRTGITNLLIEGLSPYEVSQISGHSLNSRDFTKYVKIAAEIVNKKSLAAWDHVFN